MIFPSNGRAIRQARPPVRCGNAIAMSSPVVVWIWERGPGGNGPTGGADAKLSLSSGNELDELHLRAQDLL